VIVESNSLYTIKVDGEAIATSTEQRGGQDPSDRSHSDGLGAMGSGARQIENGRAAITLHKRVTTGISQKWRPKCATL
jgi:hypothetical protein